MAELSVGTLNMTITADGSAAIAEIERVRGAAEGTARDLEGLGDGADLENLADGAGEAAESLEELGAGAEDAAGGVAKTDEAVKKADVNLKKLGESLSKAGQKMTTFVTLPIAGLMTAAVKGASDLTETVGKAEVVFGDLSERVMAWSETSISAMGLARQSALDYASTYGDMATGMGVTGAAAADMSMNLTQLAADLASFKNISADLAAQKLNAVFTGETEGLKQLGVVMTQANLQAFALSQGITQSVSSMSQAEQVMLRYRYVMEATKNAQGDFARTGDNLANQARKLGETVKQLGQSFGTQLVPVVTPVVAAAQRLAQGFAELDEGAKNAVIAVAGVAAAIGPLLLVGGKLLTFIASVKAALAALTINPIVLGLTALAAAVAGIMALKGALDDANGEIDRTSDAYRRMREAVGKPVEAEVKVEDAELEELDGMDGKKVTATVQIVTGGAAALDEAKQAVAKLEGMHFGTVAVDGDTVGIDADIADIREDLEALDGEVTITADGSAVIGEDGSGIISDIQAKLDGLKAAIPLVADEAQRATLEAQLTALQGQLDVLKAGATVTVTYTGTGDAAKNAQAFADAVAALPNGDTYSATGVFEFSDASEESLTDFTTKLAEATDATKEFDEAVGALKTATDRIFDEKSAQVYAQQAEQIALLNAAYNDGILTWEQYVEGTENARIAAQQQVEAIDAEREAAKELAEQLEDGTAANDAEAQAKLTNALMPDTSLSQDQANAAIHRTHAAAEAGEADEANAAIARAGALQAAVDQYGALSDAVDAYRTAMAEAETSTDSANAAYEAEAQSLDQMEAAMDTYLNAMEGVPEARANAVALATEGMDPETAQRFADVVTDASGALIEMGEAESALAAIDDMRAESEEKHAQALADAKQAQEDATTALQDNIAAAEGMNALGATGEDATSALAGMAAELESAGAAMSETEQAMVLGVQEMAGSMADAVASGDIEGALSQFAAGAVEGAAAAAESAAQSAGPGVGEALDASAAGGMSGAELSSAADGAVKDAAGGAKSTASSEGNGIGSSLIDGATAGVLSAARRLADAAAKVVRDAIAAAKAAADIQSPSRVMRREVGAQLVSGAVVGVEEETDRLLPRVRKATEKLMSGATGVARSGSLALPAGASVQPIDYRAMGEAVRGAVDGVKFGFAIGARDLAEATRTETSRSVAARARQINRGYGGRA